MTAKEQLARRDRSDSLDELLSNAPIDDEPERAEERDAVAEGREALRRGETVSLDEVRAELASVTGGRVLPPTR